MTKNNPTPQSFIRLELLCSLAGQYGKSSKKEKMELLILEIASPNYFEKLALLRSSAKPICAAASPFIATYASCILRNSGNLNFKAFQRALLQDS
jgi:hypothetical protein